MFLLVRGLGKENDGAVVHTYADMSSMAREYRVVLCDMGRERGRVDWRRSRG